MFDVHVHYNCKEIKDNINEELEICNNTFNNYFAIIPSWDFDSSKEAINISNNFKNLYACIGIHPSDCKRFEFDVLEKLKNLALNNKKVVSIGEIGLDFYWDKEKNIQDLQRIWFKKQIDLANELKLPIEIHTREAIQSTYDILSTYNVNVAVILHCYNASLEITKLYLKFKNIYFSFGGVLTFKNATNLKEIIKIIPLDRILIETDAPYLSPAPYRGKQNKPVYILETLKVMSELLNIELNKLENVLTNNAFRVFNIKDE